VSKKREIYEIKDLDDFSFGMKSRNETVKRKAKVKKETSSENVSRGKIKISDALIRITRQMEIMGYRERTINDYIYYVDHFANKVGLTYLSDVSNDAILAWLDSMEVSNQTKLTRLKCIKAFLSRCFDNGWFQAKFWRMVNVKVDNVVKIGATEQDVSILLSMLDLSDFVELRDAVAISLMYQCGLRIKTLSLLENKHVDLSKMQLRLGGDILKNRQEIILPLEDDTARLLRVLLKQNEIIRREFLQANGYVFITRQGECVIKGTNNALQRRLTKYAKTYGLTNVNPHALRRGFAIKLRNKGADVLLISKALGHSDLAVTTKYLGMEKEEVAEELRKYF